MAEIGLRGSAVRDPEQREAQRRRILAAAAEVFARKGYEAATMEDIAAQMGVSKGVLYYQFRSKQELVVETRRATSGAAVDRLTEIVQRPGSARVRIEAALRDLAAAAFDPLAKHVILLPVLHGLDQRYLDEVRTIERRYERLLETLLREGVAEGSLVVDDVKLTAFTLIRACFGPAVWYRPDGGLDEFQIVDRLVAHLLRSITA
ncbi:TetR/AcrR family transcriptional regulator [Pseudonocardia lutea]|jgi:AcrR family transcriptional regulator|uniref:TetR/AcrR family transcriptional regulator n=1 Tax=Pseudonocardia lutea TaxID=2172015 RepID=A0ABW1IHV6_9PSEU